MVLKTEDVGRVRVLTFDRPDALNAFNNELFAAIRDGLVAAEEDDGVAVVVLTGKGRGFCAGQDLTEMLSPAADGQKHQFPSMLERLSAFTKPLIAAVNGMGVGIGMTMLAHCDMVMMSTEAKLRTPFPQLGLAPEAGSHVTFPERIGWQNAAYVLLSGRWFNAEECAEMGLAWAVFPPDQLLAGTMAVATEIAANPIPSLVATKRLMLSAGRPAAVMDAHQRENHEYASLMGAAANAEAVSAFIEKRDPDFTSIEGL